MCKAFKACFSSFLEIPLLSLDQGAQRLSPGHGAQCVSPAEADVSAQGRHHRRQAARIYPGIHERDIPGQTVSRVGSECAQQRWCLIVIAFFILVLFFPINNKFQQ